MVSSEMVVVVSKGQVLDKTVNHTEEPMWACLPSILLGKVLMATDYMEVTSTPECCCLAITPWRGDLMFLP